ncbi:MAG: enoyl-CoA hydratase/isomerase family protein [Desulfobacteraceae bacterium]|nr:enoyl-CoA hydratase/isomerase family protein [Desulfobacteraceae bacterium]MBC2755502.1 enoyl-CoA hydratase/isomerase family protein [Desulfobacteraceae bacterium]
MMTFQTIQTEVNNEKVGILTLNRPDKRNALSIQLRQEVSECLKSWENSPEVGVVIITGSGTTFTAGFDLKEFSRPELMEDVFNSSARYHRDVWNFSKPTIAAVNGPALGGGFDLATLCDLRICSESSLFGHPEIKFGAPPLFTPLRWIVGEGLARDLCLTGRRIDANDARRIGLVSEIAGDGNLMDRAIQIAKIILEAPLATLQYTKGYIAGNSGLGFEESFAIEHDKAFKDLLIKK